MPHHSYWDTAALLLFSRTIAISVLLFAAPVYADGIYVTEDLKHPQHKYYTIKLDPKQVLDVEQRRHVTLTAAQIRRFKKSYKGRGESFLVLSTRYDSCTCMTPRYVLWGTPGEVDIDARVIAYLGEKGGTPEKDDPVSEGDDTYNVPILPSIHLIIDSTHLIHGA